jgi:hypothetical protein
MFGMGLPTMALCELVWPLGESSRWIGLGILAALGLFYMAVSLMAFYLLQRFLFSSDERQKLSSLPIPGPANGIWKRFWRSA